MANRDHSLDEGIIRAAYSDFLAYGFRDASLHKIADKAGVTTGAIYTRYKNKDALFTSLLNDFLTELVNSFVPAAAEYEKARQSGTAEDLIKAMHTEEDIYARLLTEHYDYCTLFFCRSDGSSIETIRNNMIAEKTKQTIDFFCEAYGKKPDRDAIRLLLESQFWCFRRLLEAKPEKEKMLVCLKEIFEFNNAGWRQICNTLK